MENSDGASATQQPPQPAASASIMNFLAERKVGASMWVMRIYVLILSIQFILLSAPFAMEHYFQRAMLANAVVCALRIHQRIPHFQLSRAHFLTCLEEDSAHYLIYSFIFLSCKPTTLALIPIAAFALLHTCSFSRQMIDCRGPQSGFYFRKLINAVAKNQAKFFQVIAITEMLLFPTIIFAVLKKLWTFTPFLFFKFVQYRYMSKRNPYSRLIFYEARVAAHQFSNSCPAFVSRIINQAIALCCKLCPAAAPQPQ